jgi:PKD repeat protein
MWLFEGGNPATSMEENPLVVYESLGVFNVELRATNALGTNVIIEEDFIEVFPKPSAAFNFNPDNLSVAFENTSLNATTYLWDFGDGNTSMEANPSHEYLSENNYFVQLISINDCGRDTLIQEIDLSTTLSTDYGSLTVDKFNVFPNPNNGIFTFELKAAPQESIFVTLINALGESIEKEEELDFSSGNINKQINLAEFSSGVYILGIRTKNNQRIFKKIVVLK